jgi:hypothetical protein
MSIFGNWAKSSKSYFCTQSGEPFPKKYASVEVPLLDSLQNTILSLPKTLKEAAMAVKDKERQHKEATVGIGSSIGNLQRSINSWTWIALQMEVCGGPAQFSCIAYHWQTNIADVIKDDTKENPGETNQCSIDGQAYGRQSQWKPCKPVISLVCWTIALKKK